MTRSDRTHILVIAVVSALTVSVHYGWLFPPHSGLFHAIHGRLCYIPIILGSIWFGVWGGLATALLIIAATLPYSLGSHHGNLASELTEIVFYVAIAVTTGALIELQRRERKRSEKLAHELARQQHLSSIGQMAAGLAHEIKNPLGSIIGSAEVLADDVPQDSPKHELAQVLTKETSRLNRVVDDFLRFARPRELERRAVRVNELAGEVATQIEVDSRAKGITVTRHLDADVPIGQFDDEQLRQVFLNIAINAVNAMPDGGELIISTRRHSVGDGAGIAIVFEDSGAGIDEAELDKIFDPFYSTSHGGTGLGLSISHTIVKNHGGTIEVTHRDGDRGTRVSVILPVDGG